MNVKDIQFGENRPNTIFSDIANEAAVYIKRDAKGGNKTTQLRKFYDELSLWNDKVQLKGKDKENEFKKLEAFIKMLKAKVAYAEGRKHINRNFSDIFNQCIDQINSAEDLREAKLFMEAVIGYCKLYELSSTEK